MCQSLWGAALETFVVERLLQAVSSASLELSLAATADAERERKQLDDHWQQAAHALAIRSRAGTQAIRGGRSRSSGDNLEQHLQAKEWWLADLASELSMPIATLHGWRHVGWVSSRKVTTARGRWAIYADAPELKRLRQLLDAPRGWPRPYRTELMTPKRRPDETETTTP